MTSRADEEATIAGREQFTPKEPFTTLYETVRPATESPNSINVICQGRLYFPGAAHIEKEAENEEPQLQKKRG